LAAGLETPNTQGIALEIHYINHYGFQRTQDNWSTGTHEISRILYRLKGVDAIG
jgi:hypothetical protein